MSLPHILLGLCREPRSGYDLKKEVDQYVRHFWSAELSQIYPTLSRMQSHGWLTARTEASRKGPARRVYEITETGRAELRRWLKSGPQVGNERFGYLAQIVFMDELDDPREARAFMVTLRSKLAAWRATLEMFETEIAHEGGAHLDELPPAIFYSHVGLRMGLLTLSAKLDWCDETIQRMDQRIEPKRNKNRSRGPANKTDPAEEAS